MYKKYATLLLLFSFLYLTAWLSVQGIVIDKKVAEAFTISGEKEQRTLQITDFLGVTKETISEQRILVKNEIKRECKVKITQSEYENLLRIVEAEAGGEDIIGKMLVANVVLNRVENENFPDTVNEVIFQESQGVAQFSPISDGRFYKVQISEETVEAVNQVLQGEDNSQGALYFAARKSADRKYMEWFDKNLNRLFAHGGHEFFS